MTLEEYFSTGPPHERPDLRRRARLPDHARADPRRTGVGRHLHQEEGQLRRAPSEDEVGGASFSLPRRIDHPKIARKPIDTGSRIYHVVNLRTPADLDDDVKGWLAESYVFVD